MHWLEERRVAEGDRLGSVSGLALGSIVAPTRRRAIQIQQRNLASGRHVTNRTALFATAHHRLIGCAQSITHGRRHDQSKPDGCKLEVTATPRPADTAV